MRHLLLFCCLTAVFHTDILAADETPLQPVSHSTAGRSEHSTGIPHWETLNSRQLKLKSEAALVVDSNGNEIYAKHGDDPQPIASITKLTRKQMVQLALMASENRAANALGRTWPGGKDSFVEAMNRKAGTLGMNNSRFRDPAGLDPGNVASARDVVKMVKAAMQYPLIREATTTRSISVHPYKRRGPLTYSNTNRLLKNKTWTIQLSKTGYLNEAGRCLAMQTEIADQPLVIVLLNSFGKLTPFGDSNRIRRWIERGIEG
jgi:D-alanyl-D-alanine endopeptidase (penicillin-binding protein 7)